MPRWVWHLAMVLAAAVTAVALSMAAGALLSHRGWLALLLEIGLPLGVFVWLFVRRRRPHGRLLLTYAVSLLALQVATSVSFIVLLLLALKSFS